ncbi:hypothetical protein [Hymenobacter sp. YC55]|uniref:hypothetical protein n=1 Tax=Hymenobacter sp. YC55 TaxID=3034019 RepID=UPI0023F70538|nr:hypothetical protein [Hymenobacter sp. YC55]MDF7809906.1 hypothetical protein [Hymenobacter sp. YC55]
MSLLTALPKLQQDLEQIMEDLSTAEDPAAARQLSAQRHAQAIYEFVAAAMVTTTGTATNHTGTLS